MLKRLFERLFRTQLKNKHEVMRIKRRLAIAYAFVGWHCFGVLFYVILKKEIPDDPEGRRTAYGLLTGMPTNMHVYQITGTTLTNDFDIAYNAKVAQIEKENKESENAKTGEH